MALKRIEGKEVCLIHHSDRGCQYASREYVGLLKSHGIRISMTESGGRKDTPAEASKTTGDRDMRWTSHRLLAIKSRNMADVTEKGLPLQPVSGLLPAYGLQSTTDRDKARTVNSFQD